MSYEERGCSGGYIEHRSMASNAVHAYFGRPYIDADGSKLDPTETGLKGPRALFHQNHLPRLSEIALAGQPAQIHARCQARSVPGHGVLAGGSRTVPHGGDALAVDIIDGQVDGLGLAQGEGNGGDRVEGVGVIGSEFRLGRGDTLTRGSLHDRGHDVAVDEDRPAFQVLMPGGDGQVPVAVPGVTIQVPHTPHGTI